MMRAQTGPAPRLISLLWQPGATLPLLLLVLLLGSGCHRQLNQRNGRYYSARDMVRLKQADRARTRPGSRAPVLVTKTKTKISTPASPAGSASSTKTVTRQRLTRPSTATGTLASVIEAARGYEGTPYLYGGTTRAGLDCSGLLQLAFSEAGVTIPRSSNEQAVWGDPIKPTELRPGDLLFFGPSPGASTITHVGLVTVVDADGVEFIHASTSLGVVENSFESDYYLSRFVRAVRPRL